MFDVPTTFVIGAGASCEFGLPSGAILQGQIANLLKPYGSFGRWFEDMDMDRAIDQLSKRTDKSSDPNWFASIKEVAERIRTALPFHRSIDEYINTNQGNWLLETICKLAIAVAIIKAERASALHADNYSPTRITKDRPSYASSWMSQLVRIMTAGVYAENPENMFQNVSFIVFNYDRCLELTFLRTLSDGFGLDFQAAERAASVARIVHPYGSVGSLSYHRENFVPFGTMPNDIYDTAMELATFTESVRTDISDKVKAAVLSAKQLVFLGFGYIPQNLALLTPITPTDIFNIMGTTYDVSDADSPAVRDAILKMTQQPDWSQRPEGILGRNAVKIDLRPKSCRQLIDERRFLLQREAIG